MAFTPYRRPTNNMQLGDTHVPVYNTFRPVQPLCYSHPLYYPWYVYGNQPAIVNSNDHFQYESGLSPIPSFPISTNQQYEHPYELIDEVAILDDPNNDQIINESFEQAASHVTCSGLTEKVISKNLRLTKYRQQEEEKEICVVCQDEFKGNERLGVLQCKHRYHPRCITNWLLRQNVCPICKGQGLSV